MPEVLLPATRYSFHAALLLALAVTFGGGCGRRDGAAATPATGTHPRLPARGDDATVAGRVVFEPSWRKHLSSGYRQAPPGAFVASGPTWEDWERNALSTLRVSVSGGPTAATTIVKPDGSFELPRLRPGPYKVRLQAISRGQEIRALTTAPLPIEKRSRSRVTLELLGQDLADLDDDGDRREAVVRVKVEYHAPGLQYDRVVEPGGLVRTTYAEGTVEYGAPGETVRVFNADETKEERVPGKSTKVRPKPQLLSAAARVLLEPADTGFGLVKLEAKVDLEGQERPLKVLASFYAADGRKRLEELRDDGSSEDLDPGQAGRQGSGDARAGDGVFTLLVPIDSRSYAMVYNGVVVVTALGESGGAGTSTALFLYGPPLAGKPLGAAALADKLGAVELVSRSGGVVATVAMKQAPRPPFTGALFGPEGQEAPLIAEPGGLRYTSSVISGKLAGYVFVALAGPEGVYHVGAVLGGPPEKPRRLDR